MNKKVLMGFVLLIIIGACMVFAQAPTLDKLRFLTVAGDYIVNPVNKQINGAVVIPDTYEGRPVTQSSSGGFRDCTGITSVTFQSSSVVIGSQTSTFPGDLAAKYRVGGAGIYTRQRGSDTWTRTGDVPPPTPTINTSLNGVWDNSGANITVSGSSGILSAFGTPNARGQDAINKGYITPGSQYWRNLTSTGNLTWSGQYNAITFNTASPNVATGTTWLNIAITMSENGQTLTVRQTTTSGTDTITYTRKQ